MDVVAAVVTSEATSRMFALWLDERHVFWQAMAAVLSTNAAIKRLNLDNCGIGDAGVKARRLFFAAAKSSRAEGSRGWT